MADVYNKLFTKILDSSIWLESTPSRIVWVTLLAAMDQDGYAHFSAIGNLAARARVTEEEAQAAVECFLAPDKTSGDEEFEGRRIERVPGGFIVLNAVKYRELVTSAVIRERTRLRVQKYRSGKSGNGDVLPVTPSVAVANTYKSFKEKPKKQPAKPKRLSASERESNQKRIGELLNGIIKP
jgi:hypothetical protein